MRNRQALIASFIGLIGMSACGGMNSHERKFAALVASGHYDRINPDITYQNFSVRFNGANETVFRLVHFGEWLSSEEVLKRLERLDEGSFRPATSEELLVFGAKYPDEQRKYPIVALGTNCVMYGLRCVLVLYGSSNGRYLDRDWFDDTWGSGYRFLVVRK